MQLILSSLCPGLGDTAEDFYFILKIESIFQKSITVKGAIVSLCKYLILYHSALTKMARGLGRSSLRSMY